MSSALYDLAFQANFNGVSDRLRSNPEEAEYVNGNNWTTLHILAWKKAPLQLLKAVYESHPSALQLRSKRGETPLDLARDNGVTQEVLLFLENSEKSQFRSAVVTTHELQRKMTEKCNQDEIAQKTLSHALKKIADSLTILQSENEEMRKSNLNLSDNFEYLQEENEQLKEALTSLTCACKALRDDYESEVQHTNNLQLSVETLSKRSDKFENENNQLEELVKNLKSDANGICESYEKRNELNAINFHILGEENEDSKRKISNIASSYTHLTTVTDDISNKISTICHSFDELKATNANIEESVNRAVQTKCADLQKGVSDLEGKCNNLSKDDIALQSIMSSLTDTCSDIIAQNDSSREFIAEVAENFEVLAAKNDNIKSDFVTMHNANVELRDTLTCKIHEIAQANITTSNTQIEFQKNKRIQEEDLNLTLNGLQDVTSALKSAWSSLSDDVQEAERKYILIEERQLHLENKDETIQNATKSKFDDLNNANEGLQDTISNLKGDVETIDRNTTLIEKKQVESQKRGNSLERKIANLELTVNDVGLAKKELEKRKTLMSALQALCDGYSKESSVNIQPSLNRSYSLPSIASVKKRLAYLEEHKSQCYSEENKSDYSDPATQELEVEVELNTAMNAVTP